MAKLVIVRKEQFNAMLRSAAILVDGKKVGVVGNGRTLEVTPGTHSVQSRMDWLTSRPIDVTVSDGPASNVEVSVCTALEAIFALLGMGRYLEMREIK